MQRCWTSDWAEVIAKHGSHVLVECLKRHRKASSFLPSAHDLHAQLQLVLGERVAMLDAHRTQEVLAEQDAWKEQCKREGIPHVPETMLVKNLAAEMQRMRQVCEQQFGKDWRKRGDLTQVYDEAIAQVAQVA